MNKHLLVVGIVFLITFSSVTPLVFGVNIQISKSIKDGNTLYVGGSGPGNYTKIQDAIDDASDGNTVFVYNDSSPYYENVIIDISLSLVGEDRNSTVIFGSNYDVIKILVDNVQVSGFTITNDFDIPYPLLPPYTPTGIYLTENKCINAKQLLSHELGHWFLNQVIEVKIKADENHVSRSFISGYEDNLSERAAIYCESEIARIRKSDCRSNQYIDTIFEIKKTKLKKEKYLSKIINDCLEQWVRDRK